MALYCRCGNLINWSDRKYKEPDFCFKCKRYKDQGWGEGMAHRGPGKKREKQPNDSTSEHV